MTASVRRLRPAEVELLLPALARRRHLPFARGYDLPVEVAHRWVLNLFETATADARRGSALVVEAQGAVVGGLALLRAGWESSIYGVSLARIPFLFTVSSATGEARRLSAALLDGAAEILDEMRVQHCSALVMAEDDGVVQALAERGWRLVDSTVDYTWECGRSSPSAVDPRVRLRNAVDSDRPILTALARESYTRTIRTRFSADPWLPLEKTGELYARWFDLACDGEFGDVVVVAEVEGKPVGFNTFKLDRTLSELAGVGFATHGIAAVAPEFRGLAGQPAMLHWLAEWQRRRGGRFNHGRVLITNYAMHRACVKSGAFITQAFHTFHTWRGPEPPGL